MGIRNIFCVIAALMLVTACDNDSTNGNVDVKPKPDPEYIIVPGCNAENCAATCCGNVCRDTMTNSRHCGGCNIACAANQYCHGGQCVNEGTECPPGQHRCDGVCTDVVQNADHCGGCNNACDDGFNCASRICVRQCGELANCGNVCINTWSNPDHCGGCARVCDETDACVDGRCSDKCPQEGIVCHRACVDAQSDPSHCGGCDQVCDDGFACLQSACSDVCPQEGAIVCKNTCIDISSDNANCGECGNACADNAYCLDGACVSTCDNANALVCHHACVDVSVDLQNCGGCGIACVHSQRCLDGTCISTCDDPDALVCSHVCTNVMADAANCGACGHVCSEGRICQDGHCACPASDPDCNVPTPTCSKDETLCGKTCVDAQTNLHHCGGCDRACEGGEARCILGKCIDCSGKTTCADGTCADIKTDSANCGACGISCPPNVACVDGACAGCIANFVNCDGNPETGCEKTTAECDCLPGQTRSCYFGPAGTLNVGTCRAGTMMCEGGKWGDCVGQVLPVYVFDYADVCLNPANRGRDQDCNGIADDYGDADGDGVAYCNGDCCDTKEMCPGVDPTLVGPHMLEIPDNGIDDNCNGLIDEPINTAVCDSMAGATNWTAHSNGRGNHWQPTTITTANTGNMAASVSSTIVGVGEGLARSIDICNYAASGYGLISSRVTTAINPAAAPTSSNMPQPRQVSVMRHWAKLATPTVPHISPTRGSTFAVLSSGIATDAAHNNNNSSISNVSGGLIPPKYTAVHGTNLRSHPSCTSSNSINDTVMWTLNLKAPKNAQGFSFDFRFFSYEYPQYVCTQYNDFFMVILRSKNTKDEVPKDGNIAFDLLGSPVSVNNAFFTSCTPFTCTSLSNCRANYTSCTAGLCSNAYGACPDGRSDVDAYTSSAGIGGGTAWLTTSAPIEGGEAFSIDFYIWDTGDQSLDSSVIIDNFRWHRDPTVVGTVFTDDRDKP